MGVKFIGQFLVDQGYITVEDLREAVEAQNDLQLGRLAVSKGLMSADDVLRLLSKQRFVDGMLGELAISEKLLTREALDSLLRIQRSDRRRLGEVLVEQGKLTPEEFERALDEYETDQAHFRVDDFALPDSHAHRQDIVAMLGLTQRMLLRAGGLTCKIEIAEPYSGPAMPLPYGAAITLTGAFHGRFVVGAEEGVARHLYHKMVNDAAPGDRSDLNDAFAELAGYIVGASASVLAAMGQRLELSPPRTLVQGHVDEPDLDSALLWGMHTPAGRVLLLTE